MSNRLWLEKLGIWSKICYLSYLKVDTMRRIQPTFFDDILSLLVMFENDSKILLALSYTN